MTASTGCTHITASRHHSCPAADLVCTTLPYNKAHPANKAAETAPTRRHSLTNQPTGPARIASEARFHSPANRVGIAQDVGKRHQYQDVHRTSQIHEQQQTATHNTHQQPRTPRSHRFGGRNRAVASSIQGCDRYANKSGPIRRRSHSNDSETTARRPFPCSVNHWKYPRSPIRPDPQNVDRTSRNHRASLAPHKPAGYETAVHSVTPRATAVLHRSTRDGLSLGRSRG